MSDASIITRNLHKIYQMGAETQHVLNGIDLTIPAGQFATIMGSSGSGKTTLLNVLSGLDVPTRGSVIVNDRALDNMSSNELAAFRGLTIGFVFQSYHLVPTLNALENVALPGIFVGKSKSDREERALSLLKQFGILDWAQQNVNLLSGGQRQRVAIARALFNDPPLIMADEPTGALDQKNREYVMRKLRTLATKYGKTVVLVTHEEKFAAIADRVIRLADGNIVDDTLNTALVKARGLNLTF